MSQQAKLKPVAVRVLEGAPQAQFVAQPVAPLDTPVASMFNRLRTSIRSRRGSLKGKGKENENEKEAGRGFRSRSPAPPWFGEAIPEVGKSPNATFAPPNHWCDHCNVVFPAREDMAQHDTDAYLPSSLIIELGPSCQAAMLAAQAGCRFFQQILFPIWPDFAHIRPRLQIRAFGPHEGAYGCEAEVFYSRVDAVEDNVHADITRSPDEIRRLEQALKNGVNLNPPWFVAGNDVDVSNLRRRQHFYVYMDWSPQGYETSTRWFRERPVRRPPNLDPTSSGAMSVAKTWLESCSDSGQHDCDAESKSLEMPTRLLEIDMERKRVKLVGGETALTSALTRQAGSGLTRRPYALLSYCWGGDQIVKTIRPNLEKHGKGIPIESLSRSVRDATLVAAALGLEYIWVDALCIVQDDEQEVNQEIAKMHQIFQGGYVTILAGTARSANEGFLQRRESGPRFRLPLRFPDGEQGSVILQPQIDSRSLAKLDPIFDRGWIFQEILLSPRILYFSPRQLIMDCHKSVKADGGYAEHLLQSRSLLSALRAGGSYSSQSTKFCPPLEWCRAVEAYSFMKLSNSRDKLTAFGAAAQEFGTKLFKSSPDILGNCYLAGHWQQHLPWTLLWSVRELRPRPSYRAPSWSWAAVDSPVTFPIISLPSVHRDRLTTTVRDHQIMRAGYTEFGFGPVFDGLLVVDGLMKAVPWCYIDSGRAHLKDEAHGFDEEHGVDALDPWVTGMMPPLSIWLLLVIALPSNEAEALCGTKERLAPGLRYIDEFEFRGQALLLRQKNNNEFSRIGRVELVSMRWKDPQDWIEWQDSFTRRSFVLV